MVAVVNSKGALSGVRLSRKDISPGMAFMWSGYYYICPCQYPNEEVVGYAVDGDGWVGEDLDEYVTLLPNAKLVIE